MPHVVGFRGLPGWPSRGAGRQTYDVGSVVLTTDPAALLERQEVDLRFFDPRAKYMLTQKTSERSRSSTYGYMMVLLSRLVFRFHHRWPSIHRSSNTTSGFGRRERRRLRPVRLVGHTDSRHEQADHTRRLARARLVSRSIPVNVRSTTHDATRR